MPAPVQFCYGSENSEHELPCGGGGVNGLFLGDELHALGGESFHQIQKIPGVAGKPADGLYDDGVPLPHEGKQILEFWPAGVFAAGLVDVHLIHPQLRH